MVWRLVVLGLLCGCSSVLGIHDFEQAAPIPDAPDAPPGLPPCFREPFDTLDTAVWQVTGAVSIASGQLVIPLAPNTVESRSVKTIASLDMTEGDVYVEVPKAINQTGYVSNGVRITVNTGTNSRYSMVWGAGGFTATITDEGTDATMTSGFMPGDKLWRFSHRGGTVTLYTSSSGASWTTQVSRSVSKQPTTVTIELYAGAYGNNADPGEAHYDRAEVITPACQ